MDNQLSFVNADFSFSRGLSFSVFSPHCTHRGYRRPATDDHCSCWMCGYYNGSPAKCWDDWVPCSSVNCFLFKL